MEPAVPVEQHEPEVPVTSGPALPAAVEAGTAVVASAGTAEEAGCKDRWTKRGGELGLFQISKIDKTTLTYAMLVRLNSPTG